MPQSILGSPIADMVSQAYKKPPITEAVIALSVDGSIDADDLGKVAKRLSADYPVEQTVSQIEVKVGGGNPRDPISTTSVSGHKVMSSDATEIVVLMPSTFTVSQLAPYPGWDAFIRRFVSGWEQWKRVVGYRKLSRIGVRYINRIDVPLSGREMVRVSDYLGAYVSIPDGISSPMTNFAMHTEIALDGGVRLLLKSSSVPSPLMGNASFVLDLDFVMDSNVPQKDEAIVEALYGLRATKNDIFEMCVTEASRELFA